MRRGCFQVVPKIVYALSPSQEKVIGQSSMKHRTEEKVSATTKAFDVCVIGGGATGAGCALDAQLRGLSTLLLDAGDFASAASSASTKLVHGGVRYLEQAVKSLNLEEYRMGKNAVCPRHYMLATAPHL